MKNLNLLEEQLRRWRPRPPSIRFEERIFGRNLRETERPVTIHDAWAWLAPVTAAWLFFVLLLSLEITPDRQLRRELSAASYNSKTAYGIVHTVDESAPGIRRNSLPKGIFEWTSTRPLISDRGSFLLLNTNRLRP